MHMDGIKIVIRATRREPFIDGRLRKLRVDDSHHLRGGMEPEFGRTEFTGPGQLAINSRLDFSTPRNVRSLYKEVTIAQL